MEAKRIVFPFELDANGSLISKTEEESLKESIMSILSWPIDTLPFNRDYGSNLYRLLGLQNEPSLVPLVKVYTIEALTAQEKRLQLLECRVSQDYDSMTIFTRYLALKSQLVNSLNILLT